MFDHNSRYFSLETATYVTKEQRKIAYKRRRFLPRGKAMQLLVEVTFKEGDRLDMITARSLGDPEQFWRIADANDVMKPDELTDELGRSIRVPVPQG